MASVQVSASTASTSQQAFALDVTVTNAPQQLAVTACVTAASDPQPADLPLAVLAGQCKCSYINAQYVGGQVGGPCEGLEANGDYVIYAQYVVDNGGTSQPISLSNPSFTVGFPSVTSSVVPKTNVAYGFTANVEVENWLTDGLLELRVYDSQQSVSTRTVHEGQLCSATGKQGSVVNLEVRDCELVSGVQYYYYVWFQVGTDMYNSNNQYLVEVDDSIQYTCEADSYTMSNGEKCWDDKYTCLSCCNSGVGLPPNDDRDCFRDGQLTKEECCGDANDQVLLRSVDGNRRV